ncbi:restriction endonuclease [Candidatus Deianiraea vastatrix]|uniref:Restriction/modification system protein n=1 Tax=Candidatus Deianiraea vastatrix TaxID=2163644 RepID=A0A5B8XCK0_9RICK|nr:restriction endonuclease [Candidatus Deianiraea vastatrix]QED23089.1 Putative restriction/modification system protein [Candidatus Deianiraea vastatrix]
MAVPSYTNFLFFVLNQMKDGKSYRRNSDELRQPIRDAMRKRFVLTDEDMNEKLKTGGSRFEDRIGWAFTFLIKAEYIEKSQDEKYTYLITELGKAALDDVLSNNKVLDEKYLKENSPNYIKNWNTKIIEKETQLPENDDEDDEIFNLENAVDEMRKDAEVKFITKLREMSWQNFEDFCARLIEKMGYGVASKREIRVRDGGIDGIIYTDELGIRDKVYIQAKRYGEQNPVASKDLQAFLHILSKQKAKGIFITTSKFSSDALEVAKDDEKAGNVALIDYKKLTRLCAKYKCGFRGYSIEILEVDL